MEQQVRYIVKNNFGLTSDEAEAVLHPGKEVGGLVYEEKDNTDFVGGKFVPNKMKTGTLQKGQEHIKELQVGPLHTDRPDPQIDNTQTRIQSIELLVREGKVPTEDKLGLRRLGRHWRASTHQEAPFFDHGV